MLGCHYLLFAVGPLVNGDISYHGSGTTKTASNSTICIEECGTYQRNISYRYVALSYDVAVVMS